MKIVSINNFAVRKPTPKKVNSTPMKPAFKADVRISDKWYSNNSVTDKQINEMERLLEDAKTAYQNIGNDNLLVVLAPVIRKRFLAKDALDVAAVAVYKDPEKARLDIIEKLKKECPDNEYLVEQYIKNDDNTDSLTQSAHYIPYLSVQAEAPRDSVTTKQVLDWFFTCMENEDTLGDYRITTRQQHIRIMREPTYKDALYETFHPNLSNFNPDTITTPSP